MTNEYLKVENKETGDVKYFDSRKDVMEFTGVCTSEVSRVIRGENRSVKGWRITPISQKEYINHTDDMKIAMSSLVRDKKGRIIDNVPNLLSILSNHPSFKNRISCDAYSNRVYLDGEPINDLTESTFISQFTTLTGYFPSDRNWRVARNTIAHSNTFNKIMDMLNDLPEWDGEERMEEYFIKIIGALDTPLNREMTRNFFHMMMKRQFEPGCNCDAILIAVDPTQGTGKSEVIDRITKGFSIRVNINDISDDETKVKYQSFIALNFDEMSGWTKQDVNNIKTFITEKEDTIRYKYQANPFTIPRHCVYFGSTNDTRFLKDYSGVDAVERRFWIMECNGVPNRPSSWYVENHSIEYIDQVLAEALYKYKANPTFDGRLSSSGLNELRQLQQTRKSFNSDLVTTEIFRTISREEFSLDELSSAYKFKKAVSIIQKGEDREYNPNRSKLQVIGASYINQLNPKNSNYNEAIMLNLGWSVEDKYFDGRVQKCFVRTESVDTIVDSLNKEIEDGENGEEILF